MQSVSIGPARRVVESNAALGLVVRIGILATAFAAVIGFAFATQPHGGTGAAKSDRRIAACLDIGVEQPPCPVSASGYTIVEDRNAGLSVLTRVPIDR